MAISFAAAATRVLCLRLEKGKQRGKGRGEEAVEKAGEELHQAEPATVATLLKYAGETT